MKSLIGKVVGGCQLLNELGQGGMGVIYKAKQLSLDRDVAMKVLADRLAGDPDFVERFQREARAIARVNHPNILAVYDVGRDQDLNIHYMIMELIDGRSLADIIKDRGVLDVKSAADYVKQSALGLACAQQSGIIHRDIKPENIMVTRQDVVKVSDFGLAKELGGNSMTATDSVMGTPAYMSPEQCDGKKLDGRTDIYSLGGSFFRLITGRLPFEAETAMSMMYRHKHEPVTPPRQIVPAIPQGISDCVVKMMAKRREDRFQKMEEVAAAIDAALAQGPGPSATDTGRTIIMPKTTAAAPSPTPPRSPSTGGFQFAGASPDEIIASPKRRELDRLLAQADAKQKRGDLVGATRLWREAAGVMPEDPRPGERITQHALPEARKSLTNALKARDAGQLAEASRLLRQAAELDPSDKNTPDELQKIETTIGERREALNQLRQVLASNRYEEALRIWEAMPESHRDPGLETQIKNIRDVIMPVQKLCEQAETTMADGDLEQGLALYRRAHEVDPQNERAADGVRTTEQRLNRIERMLKEGYEFNVKEDYSRAINAWAGILKIAPDHARAKKLIAEARLRVGHAARLKEGGVPEAIEQWKKILEIEPDHRVAQALLDEDVHCQQSLAKYSEEAQGYYSRKRYGPAIRAWERMLDLDPNNRRIALAVEGAKKLRRKARVVRLGILTALLLIGAAGAQIAREGLAYRQASALESETRFIEASTAIERVDPVIFLGSIINEKKRELRFKSLFQRGDEMVTSRRYEQAIELYRLAGQSATERGRQTVEERIARARVKSYVELAEGFEERENWQEARSNYSQAEQIASESRIDDEVRRIQRRTEFLRLVDEAILAEKRGQMATATGFWKQAHGIRPEHVFVQEAFARLRIKD